MILFIALPEAENKIDPGVTRFPLELLPRRCPLCGNQTIIGHGQRRKQAHDQVREVIYVRRGLCRPCRRAINRSRIPSGGHLDSFDFLVSRMSRRRRAK